MSEYRRALIAMGSNLAQRGLSGAALLREAVRSLDAAQLFVRAASNVWESDPQPPSEQPRFVNAVVACDAGTLSTQEVWQRLARIERDFGRKRRVKWEARTLDLDLIDLDGIAGAFDGIELPHPRAHERAFVLAPLAEVAPDWRHPLSGLSAGGALAQLAPDRSMRRLGPLLPKGG